jgi:predicted GIY-YIG superfamily endonuclease
MAKLRIKRILMFYVYLIKFKNFLYTGQTDNLSRRLKEHGLEGELQHTEKYPTRKEAVARERQIKGWSHAKKEALIAGDKTALKQMAKRGVKAPLSLKEWNKSADIGH